MAGVSLEGEELGAESGCDGGVDGGIGRDRVGVVEVEDPEGIVAGRTGEPAFEDERVVAILEDRVDRVVVVIGVDGGKDGVAGGIEERGAEVAGLEQTIEVELLANGALDCEEVRLADLADRA